ncbi:MAG: FHA domain-containing protein [Usitatibacter sp.]
MLEETTGCVLVADVSGATQLHETAGDPAADEAVALCVKLFAALTLQHGGRVVKAGADEVCALFPDAGSAGLAARDIQLSVNDMAPVEKVRLAARVGMHYGAVRESGGDIFGDTVSLAARLAEMAARGQIVASMQAVERLTPIQKMDCREIYSIPVASGEGQVAVCELMWNDADDATQVSARHVSTDAGESLRLVYRTRVVVLAPGSDSVELGRDTTAGLVVNDRMASRAHCAVERRSGQFVLSDHSANGTYLSIDGEREVVLRREEAALRGHGFITLGQSRSSASEFVEFFCE